ncbi:MAG TPA: TonB-dependent receptor [Thermoguttaceae bacterium]|nr:TonB-dependent receptor [Thermoguttaceae bacterium]
MAPPKAYRSAILWSLVSSLIFPCAGFAQSNSAAARTPFDVAWLADEQGQGDAASTKKEGEANGDLDFLNKDIQELSRTQVKAGTAMGTEVTSVSRQTSTIGQSPAAVFVITNEMIRRSGYRTVPDLLRLAPGVKVAKISSNSWAIGIRGQQSRFSKLLLVMIDGRSIYNPVFGGVFWDMQDLLFEDIERIEVIRGPGGTIWGANAVDGVINIITKKASESRGVYAEVGGGNYDLLNEAVRVGGGDDEFSWRMWGKHFERGPGYLPGEGLAWDDWRAGNGGFRMDWDPCRCNHFTALGQFFAGSEGQRSIWPVPYDPFYQVFPEDMDFTGQSVLLRWEHTTSEDSDWKFQTYYDRNYRKQVMGDQMWTTMDFDFQHRFPLGDRHNVIWGLNHRQIFNYEPDGSFFLSFSPTHITYNEFSGFIQDEIELAEDRWFLTAGTKLGRDNFCGFQVQPSIRLLWTPDERHSLWGAISRPISTPALYQETGTVNFGPSADPVWPTFLQLTGTNGSKSEKLLAYEIGYRTQATERFSWDVATYYNVYEDLHGFAVDSFNWVDPYFVAHSDWINDVGGTAYGVELSACWDITDRWRLWGFYDFQYLQWEVGSAQETLVYGDGDLPMQQFRVQSSWTLSPTWDFDAVLRYVDNLKGLDVPRYLTMDLRLAWKPTEHFEAAIVGQNLLDTHFYEFYAEPYGLGATEVRRTVFGQMVWRY